MSGPWTKRARKVGKYGYMRLHDSMDTEALKVSQDLARQGPHYAVVRSKGEARGNARGKRRHGPPVGKRGRKMEAGTELTYGTEIERCALFFALRVDSGQGG